MRSVYTVEYKMFSSDTVKHIDVIAGNKEEAYVEATFNVIPLFEDGAVPYSSWVYSVTYQNGNEKRFNTHEGKPY